jgi:ABC-type Fe3+/spermidine/putrescine transport system ATPase subunit
MTIPASSIALRGVSKSFGAQQVLADITLTIDSGEIVALLGASGGGKSTLLNLISGLLPADGGEIALQGIPASRFPHWQRIAYLFQEDRRPGSKRPKRHHLP